MLIERLTTDNALERGHTLPWALVRCLSTVTLGPVPADICPEELIEARFFSADEEIRVFRSGGQFRAVHLCGEPKDNTLERTYHIENSKFGKTISVCYTLEADEDGQMNLGTTRLTGWEGSV